jgi:hypothetical protein
MAKLSPGVLEATLRGSSHPSTGSMSQRVVEDERRIEKLVGRPAHRWNEQGSAWLSRQHDGYSDNEKSQLSSARRQGDGLGGTLNRP